MREMEKQLKALANKRRLAIISYLRKVTTASVGDISKEIKLSFKSTSRHLAVLLAAEIVQREQINLTAFYTLSKKQHPVTAYVASLC